MSFTSDINLNWTPSRSTISNFSTQLVPITLLLLIVQPCTWNFYNFNLRKYIYSTSHSLLFFLSLFPHHTRIYIQYEHRNIRQKGQICVHKTKSTIPIFRARDCLTFRVRSSQHGSLVRVSSYLW